MSHFERLLADGTLRPGMRLPPERELAHTLGVGRPALREALRALAVLGAVETRHGTGNFIAAGAPKVLQRALAFFIPLTGTSLLELFQTRKALEVALAGRAAENARSEHLAAMQRELRAMRAQIDDLKAYNAAEERFHEAITAGAGNALMAAVMMMLQERLREGRRRTRILRPAQRSYGEHEAIYTAIATRDSAAAREAMHYHLDQVEQLIRPWLARSEWPPLAPDAIPTEGATASAAAAEAKV
ncbi:MAG: FadR/GntR family transcriptional regulator [Chloroflexota bacterium]